MYKPELGQMIFGNPYQEHKGTGLLEAALGLMSDELERVMLNKGHHNYLSPFSNTGNKYENSVFKVHAYDWGDEDQPWNLKWGDFEVSWYKYYTRGLSCNKPPEPKLIEEMLDACLESVRREDVDG